AAPADPARAAPMAATVPSATSADTATTDPFHRSMRLHLLGKDRPGRDQEGTGKACGKALLGKAGRPRGGDRAHRRGYGGGTLVRIPRPGGNEIGGGRFWGPAVDPVSGGGPARLFRGLRCLP